MEFGDTLKKAWAEVQAADLPEGLQALALKEALDFYLAEPRKAAERRTPQPLPKDGNGDEGSGAVVGTDEFLAQVAHGSGVDVSVLEDVMTLIDGKVHILLPRRVFKGTVISEARAVMTVVAGARRFGFDERATPADTMREVLQGLDLYDSKNFKSKHILEVPGTSYVKAQATLLAKGDLHQKFAEAVQRLHDAANA